MKPVPVTQIERWLSHHPDAMKSIAMTALTFGRVEQGADAVMHVSPDLDVNGGDLVEALNNKADSFGYYDMFTETMGDLGKSSDEIVEFLAEADLFEDDDNVRYEMRVEDVDGTASVVFDPHLGESDKVVIPVEELGARMREDGVVLLKDGTSLNPMMLVQIEP